MSTISDLLKVIMSARYGKDVRQSIHDAIEQCYADATGNPASIASHVGNYTNPHKVTASQVGLGNVNNTSDANKPISTAQAAVNEAQKTTNTTFANHIADKDNPHAVTKADVGLGNCNNTSDANKPISIAQAAVNTSVATSLNNLNQVEDVTSKFTYPSTYISNFKALRYGKVMILSGVMTNAKSPVTLTFTSDLTPKFIETIPVLNYSTWASSTVQRMVSCLIQTNQIVYSGDSASLTYTNMRVIYFIQ